MAQPQYELQVIGSGAGASYLYDGLCSSSFMLTDNGKPFCLVDIGFGVTQKVLETFGAFPQNLIVTHNHSDHAGELPVVLRVEQAQGRLMKVFAESQVAQQLKTQRLGEHLEVANADDLADWQTPLETQSVLLYQDLTIAFYPGIHSVRSCGFIIRQQGQAVLAYTGDSIFDSAFYQCLAKADVFIMDARKQPNRWHASFAEVADFQTPNGYILGHGLSIKDALEEKRCGANVLLPGDKIPF